MILLRNLSGVHPTAAAVAAVYALLVGLFIYREVKPRDLRRVLMNTVINTAIVLFVMERHRCLGGFNC